MEFFPLYNFFKHTLFNILTGCRTRSPTNLQHLCCKALIKNNNNNKKLVTTVDFVTQENIQNICGHKSKAVVHGAKNLYETIGSFHKES